MCQPLFMLYLHCLERKAMKHCLTRERLSIFEKLSPGNKLQIPNSKLQRSTKLQAQKPTCAPFAPASAFAVGVLRLGTSLGLGVWCLVFRSAAAQKPRCAPRSIPKDPLVLDSHPSTLNSQNGMIARVTMEIALRKEFDYLIPPELEGQVEVGTRVKVPFGPRQVMGCVTALVEQSPHTNLRPILKVVGTRALVTPNILKLARWIADYYCCPVEIALKSVLPEVVRKEKEGWRERLFVRALPLSGDLPQLTKRQQDVWNIIEEWRELPLQELLELAQTTADTVRKLEDKGLVSLGPKISERDPYANEHILPTQPLALNSDQAAALAKIKGALEGGKSAAGAPPAEKVLPASCRQDVVRTFTSPFFNKAAEVNTTGSF